MRTNASHRPTGGTPAALCDRDAGGCVLYSTSGVFSGRWITHSGWYPDYKLRLFRKTERVGTGGSPRVCMCHWYSGYLRGDLLHYTYRICRITCKRSIGIALLARRNFSPQASGPVGRCDTAPSVDVFQEVSALSGFSGRLPRVVHRCAHLL